MKQIFILSCIVGIVLIAFFGIGYMQGYQASTDDMNSRWSINMLMDNSNPWTVMRQISIEKDAATVEYCIIEWSMLRPQPVNSGLQYEEIVSREATYLDAVDRANKLITKELAAQKDQTLPSKLRTVIFVLNGVTVETITK